MAKNCGTIEGSSAFRQVRGLNASPVRVVDGKDEWTIESSLVPCFCPECCMGVYGVDECKYKQRRQLVIHNVTDQSDDPDVIKLQYLKKHFKWKGYVNMDGLCKHLDGERVQWHQSDKRPQLLTKLYNAVTGEAGTISDTVEEFLEEKEGITETVEENAADQLDVLAEALADADAEVTQEGLPHDTSHARGTGRRRHLCAAHEEEGSPQRRRA